MKKILLLLFCGFVAIAASAQQEPHYSQNQFNSNLMINPAYAGAAEHSSIGLRYRRQWAGMDGTPVTIGLITESKVFSDRLGLGICLNRDQIGIDRSTSADANIAYHLPVTKKAKLALGFKIGATWLNSDFSKLANIAPGDPLYGTTQDYTLPYVGVGLLYYTDRYYLGISSPRLISFEKAAARSSIITRHFYLYGGLKLRLDDQLEIRPALLTKFQPQAPPELDLAVDLWYNNRFGCGLAYRTGDAVMFMIKLRYQKVYLGYSYDLNISGLRPFNQGSHEFFIGFEWNRKSNNEPLERVNDLRYF